MKGNNVCRLMMLLGLMAFTLMLNGCSLKQTQTGAGQMATSDVQHFEMQIDQLVSAIAATQYGTKGEFAPVAVVPGAIKHGTPYTHLEEVIAGELKKKLQKTNDLYVFTSQNWFEYREDRPLSFVKSQPGEREILQQMKIFEVRLNPEPVFNKAEVEIVVSDADGRILQGQRASATIDFSRNSPAVQLHNQPINRNPFPEGIEERPFTSIDRFAFSLVGDLIDTYEAGVLTSGRHASREDVQVVLSVTPTRLIPQRTLNSITKTLQHAIVRAKGVTCVLSPQDSKVAEKDVQHGTVLLVVDVDRVGRSDVITVSMRGVWKVSPLETASGAIVDENLAGTYLSGFTARAYLQLPKRGTVAESGQTGSDGLEMTVCFYGADDILIEDSYRALRHVPGLEHLQWLACTDDNCGCWDIIYTKSVDHLAGWLRKQLGQYTEDIDHSVRLQGPESIDVIYSHGGE